jgi:hypothetical protein
MEELLEKTRCLTFKEIDKEKKDPTEVEVVKENTKD